MIMGTFRLYMTKDGVWAYNISTITAPSMLYYFMSKSMWTHKLVWFLPPVTVSGALSGPLEILPLESSSWLLLVAAFFFSKFTAYVVRWRKTPLKSEQNCWLGSQIPNIGAVEGKGFVFTIFWRPEASFKQVCFDSYQVLGSHLMLFFRKVQNVKIQLLGWWDQGKERRVKAPREHILFGGLISPNSQTCSWEWISAAENKARLVSLTFHPTGVEGMKFASLLCSGLSSSRSCWNRDNKYSSHLLKSCSAPTLN